MPRRAAPITTLALLVTALAPLIPWTGEKAIAVAAAAGIPRPEAGEGSVAAGDRPSQSSKDQPARPSFRSGAGVVQVSLRARDQSGRPVTDLTRADVTVTEEGTPQEIVAFDRISLPRVHLGESPAPAATGPAQDVSTNE